MSRSSSFLGLVLAATSVWVEVQAVESRELYPDHNGGCYWIESRAECCKHKDGRNYTEAGHYYHEYCVPAAEGTTFTSGRVCEPECWVHGWCGDGTPQGDRIGRCAASDDDNILVVSEDTSTRMATTTPLFIWDTTTTTTTKTGLLSGKGKIIAEAVAGSVGGVALLGGLLGGLITTATTTPSTTLVITITSTTTGTTTATPTLNVSHFRFLEGHNLAARSEAPHFGSPWLAALGLGVMVSAAVLAAVFQGVSRRNAARNFTEVAEAEESTDNESVSPAARSGPDAFDLIDKNHDGVISRAEFNAAYGIPYVAQGMRLTALPVYVLPASPYRVQQ